MALSLDDLTAKVDNGGVTPEGLLTAEEYNTLLAAVKENAENSTDGHIGSVVVDNTLSALDLESKKPVNSEGIASAIAVANEGVLNNIEFNKYIQSIFCIDSTFDSVDVKSANLSIAVYNSSTGKYYNQFYLRDSSSKAIIGIERSYATESEALLAWNSGAVLVNSLITFAVLPKFAEGPVDLPTTSLKLNYRIESDSRYTVLTKIYKLATKDELQESISKIVVKSVNLFNGETINGRWQTPNFISHSNYRASAPIKVESGKYYKYKANSSLYGSTAGNYGAYNDKMELIDVRNSNADTDGYVTIICPVDVSYISVNIGYSSAVDSFMLCEADNYPEEYIPYQKMLNDEISVKASQIKGQLPPEAIPDNPLSGKILSLNGDSICAGAGFEGGYGKIIAERNGMTYENKAVGGATITSGTTSSSGANRHWICDTISTMREDADYAIVEGGVNDASIGLPLGVITNSYTEALDTSTFYGAFEKMLKELTTRFAGKKIGYVFVHQMASLFRHSNSPDESYYWAAKKCCEKWGVPYCDLNIAVPAFAFFGSGAGALYDMRNTYTLNGDGWHPNEEGYKKYYCDKIESWMKTL